MSDAPTSDDFVITIPKPYLVAMGKVTVVWGVLESLVDLAIARLAGYASVYDPRPAIITAHMTWPLKMDVLEALAAERAKEDPKLAQFGTVTKPALRRAQEARNQIAHGHWAYQDGKVYRLRTTARGKLKPEIKPISVAEIDAAFGQVSAGGRALLKVVFGA